MKLLLLISLVLVLTFGFAESTLASTSKNVACNYSEGTYPESLETIGLKNALVSEFHKRDYYDHNELWYIVKQTGTNISGKITKDDYSLYSYNCKTKTPRRVFWQLIFRSITAKLPESHLYSDVRLLWISGNYIEVGFFPDSTKCAQLKNTCDKNSYYRVTIDWNHTFTIDKPVPDRGSNEYQRIGTYKY